MGHKTSGQGAAHLFRIGDILPIYQKPYTFEEYEGDAKLIRHERDMHNDAEMWLVRFEDGTQVLRTIAYLRIARND